MNPRDDSERPATPNAETNARLLQSERLATLGRMTAMLAHEIRTPLTSIGGFARRIVRNTPPEDPRREELEIIVGEVARLERLIDEVLGFSRISRICFESLDLNAEIASLLLTLQEDLEHRGITQELKTDEEHLAITGDAAQLRQAILNLVVNAMEAMPEGGRLTVSTRRQGDDVHIAVSDTGPGIRPEDRERLFAPFFTTKVSGTGLGLVIVSQVVENHRGSVDIESAVGTGTTFHVRLPQEPC